MAKHKVVVCCWKHYHKTDMEMTLRQEQALPKKIDNLKAVCPVCRDEHGENNHIFILEGETVSRLSKIYRCRHGHVNSIGAFTNGMLHVTFGNDRSQSENTEGTIEELEEMIDKKVISCHHVSEKGRACGCKLKAVDKFSLNYPSALAIKTKTRVGDIWDKAGATTVRSGSYDKDGHYNSGTGEKANLARISAMQKRNAKKNKKKSPGTKITKATNKKYAKRSKSGKTQ